MPLVCDKCGGAVRRVFFREDGTRLCSVCYANREGSHPTTAVIGDEIPGGMVLENYGPQPIKVYSHTERKQAMAKAGLNLKEKFCPMPGTDIDPAGIPNPKGYMDPQTLANAAELICRNGKKAPDWDGEASGVLRISTGELSPEEVSQFAGSK